MSFSVALGQYQIGDTISTEHQEMEFNYCYPSDLSESSFSFSTHPNQVFMIQMSATWCAPCLNAIPEGEAIYQHWEGDDRVEIIHFLADLNQPYNCTQWGNIGTLGIPPIALITSTDNNSIRTWFPEDPASGAIYPTIIFINHNMQIINIEYGALTFDDTNLYINCMLDAR